MKFTSFEDYDRELQTWLGRLRTVDDLLEKPALTLIDALHHARTRGTGTGVTGTAICELPIEHDHDRSLLVDVACSAAVQRLSMHARRFGWLNEDAPRAQLKELMPNLLAPLRDASASAEPLMLLEAMRDDVFGAPNPLLAADVFGILIRSGEREAHAELGFFSLFCILWRLARKSPDGSTVGASIEAWRPSAVVTAKCLAPIRLVTQAMRRRAELYRSIAKESLELRSNFGGQDQHTRWKLASSLERLASLLYDFSVVATNPTDFQNAADQIAAMVRPITATYDWKRRRHVWRSIRELIANVLIKSGELNITLLAASRKMLDGIQTQIIDNHRPTGKREVLSKYSSTQGAQLTESYWTAQREAAEAALTVCRDALKQLEEGARNCVALTPPSSNRSVGTGQLFDALVDLQLRNEQTASLVENTVKSNVRWLRGILTQEIAFASAGNDTDFDAAELLSAVSTVERWLRISDMEIEDAVRHSLVSKRHDGSWSTGQPIFLKHRVLGVWPNTAEIASLVATTIEGRPQLRVADDTLADFVSWLDKTKVEFHRTTPCGPVKPATEPEPKKRGRHHREPPPPPRRWSGWPAETREHDVIDLWSTALSVTALLTLREIIEYRLWELARQRFHVDYNLQTLWNIDPVDLGARHEKRLHHRIALMARETRGERYPNAEYSLIFHGPPGSSKTAIAGAIASEMWKHGQRKQRLIRITPADFTRQGEARIDSEARFIFDLLSHIRSVTIFFDEIDDLLRKRRKEGQLSFLNLIVPAMLNRLQDLRDAAPRQEICFLMATNYIDSIEPALTRPGRIDSLIPLPYPDRWSRENILAKKKLQSLRHSLKEMILDATDGWPWSTFNNLCKKIVGLYTRQHIQQMIAYHKTQFEDSRYYYEKKARWGDEISRPLMNEVSHTIFASASTLEAGLRHVERLSTYLPADDEQVKPRKILRELFEEEWKREGRFLETQATEREDRPRRRDLGDAVTIESPSNALPGARTTVTETEVRVWAPSAYGVAIGGTFNGWSVSKNPLVKSKDGFWEALIGYNITAGTGATTEVPQAPGHEPEGQYKFVIFNADSPRPHWRNDPYAAELFEFPYEYVEDGAPRETLITNSIVPAPYEWKSEPLEQARLQELVLYQLHPGTFTRNDGPALDGVTKKLDHLADLGVNAIEILVTGEYAIDDWGYSSGFPYAIQTGAGGDHGFARLVDEAHQRGIHVFFGLVCNRVGSVNHALWHYDGWNPAENIGGIYYRWPTSPEDDPLWPEFDQPEVRRLFLDTAVRFATDRRVDGFRWHAAPTLIRRGEATHGEYTGWHLIRDVNRQLRELKKITIAEDVDETPEDRTQIELGENGARCDLVWDARFMQRLHAVLHANENERDMGLLAAALPAAFPRVIYSDSYDEARKPTRIPRTETAVAELALLGMAFVLTAPGVPMLFQGQEFIDRTVFSSHSSVDWNAANAHRAQLAVVRQLIRCRRNRDGTTPGLTGEQIDIRLRDDAQQVIGYWRWDGAKETPKNCTVVVANLRGRDAQFRMEVPESGTWISRCTSWGKAITVAESDGHFVMGLPAYGFAVLSRQT